MAKRRFVLVRRGPRKYRKKLTGTGMLSPKVRKVARRLKLRPDYGLRKGQYGTFRRHPYYLVLKGPRGRPAIRRAGRKGFISPRKRIR